MAQGEAMPKGTKVKKNKTKHTVEERAGPSQRQSKSGTCGGDSSRRPGWEIARGETILPLFPALSLCGGSRLGWLGL